MSTALKENVYNWNNLIQDVAVVMSKETGNVMGEKQYPMIESRLKRRCTELKITNPADYKQYWTQHQTEENKHLIGLLTTHFTSFFREFSHFEWLAGELPSIVAHAKKEGRSTIKLWSAACSKGQEVWSLCMWLQFHMPKIDPSMSWQVHGSDIDPVSVKEAENGVYHRRELETAPRHLWEGYWIRGKDEISDWYKIKSDLKAKTKFFTMNLLKPTVEEKFDVIICRNVLIYFDRDNQENIAKSLLKRLTPEGTLITGMSESLSGFGLPIRGVAPSVYKPQSATVVPLPVKTKSPMALELPKPLKIFCIDDSPTVLTIMKKILSGPDFEIIGTAANGQEAIEKLKTLKPDAITLDLHMPIMDGPTFLNKSGIGHKIPVVIVSSVGREHAPIMSQIADSGVSDFVEKPTLTNINQIGDELMQKLRMGWMTKHSEVGTRKFTVNASKKRPGGAIYFNFGKSDERNVLHVLNEQKWENDEIIFSFNGSTAELEVLKLKLKTAAIRAKKVVFTTSAPEKSAGPTIWLQFKSGNFETVKFYKKATDFVVVEEGSVKASAQFDDESPITSFSYLVDKLLGGE